MKFFVLNFRVVAITQHLQYSFIYHHVKITQQQTYKRYRQAMSLSMFTVNMEWYLHCF